MTWILFILIAIEGICVGVLARQIEALEADLLKTRTGLGHTYIELKKRLDEAERTVQELNKWNGELCECLEQAVRNLEETDRRCRDIERYYINYVTKNQEEENEQSL